MWRLRIAEGGGDPWLRSKNGHVGRQVWEFDATAESDPDVEAARQGFTERRHHLKHSADLLMRLQVTISPCVLAFSFLFHSRACRRHDRFAV